jgi:hypothetical protein
MSILNEGRYKGNLAWVGQLLHNDGFQALHDWINTLPQTDKDDVRFMMELLAREVSKVAKESEPAKIDEPVLKKPHKPKMSKPGIQGLVEAEKVVRMKPKLRLVKPPVDPKGPSKD